MSKNLLFFLLTFTLTSLVQCDTIDPAIIGGVEAKEGDFPYMVVLSDDKCSLKAFCTGTIISKRHVLTSASCAGSFINVTVCYDSIDADFKKMKKIDVEKIYVNEYFNSESYDYDVAVLKLVSELNFTKTTDSVKLGSKDVPEKQFGIIAGWGNANSQIWPRLRQSPIEVVPKSTCGPKWSERTMCGQIKNISSCSLDVGGPLIYNKEQVGIVLTNTPCQVNTPTAFTKISTVKKWIDEKVSSASTSTLNMMVLLLSFVALTLTRH